MSTKIIGISMSLVLMIQLLISELDSSSLSSTKLPSITIVHVLQSSGCTSQLTLAHSTVAKTRTNPVMIEKTKA